MNFYKNLIQISKIEEALLDEESKAIFRARINYMFDKNEDDFLNVMESLDKKWYCPELDEFMNKSAVKGIIIFGSGHDGILTKKILEYCNYVPQYFCDSDKSKVGKVEQGIEVISVDDLLDKYRDFGVVLGSRRYAQEICHILLTRRFPPEKILCPMYNNMLMAHCGNQYFDVFSPRQNEVFVDGGAFNGDSSFDFISWAGGKVKIYAFEPNEKMAKIFEKRIEREGAAEVELYQNILWNKRENLSFFEDRAASRVEKKGKTIVEAISLDEVVKEDKITFIKLDVEGSELRALEGAKNTIARDKPRLAISIYHKPEDVLELPIYILKLVPEYKFYIRHYDFDMGETILYAQI